MTEHTRWACTCGWEPKLGESVHRAFDHHLLDVREQSAIPPGQDDAVPKSSWNYRVTRTKVDGEYVFEIREVYYTYDQPHSWSSDPIAPYGESWHELAEDLVKMQRAVSQPVLDLTGDKPRDMTLKEMVRSRVIPPKTGDA